MAVMNEVKRTVLQALLDSRGHTMEIAQLKDVIKSIGGMTFDIDHSLQLLTEQDEILSKTKSGNKKIFYSIKDGKRALAEKIVRGNSTAKTVGYEGKKD